MVFGPRKPPTDFPPGFQSDHRLRSDFVRRLGTDSSCLRAPERSTRAIPKVVVRFWHDGGSVPFDVQRCMATWERLRVDGFAIRTFDDASAESFIAKVFGGSGVSAFRRCGHPAMRSDYFRLCYILSEGGFYVDADDVLTEGRWSVVYHDATLKLQPLCYDAPTASMVPAEDLWKPVPDQARRTYYVNNAPLAAPPGHPVIREALATATAKLSGGTPCEDVQATTGPGNLTAALASHARRLWAENLPRDLELMRDWHRLAETRWELSYREDWRNWRNWRGPEMPGLQPPSVQHR